MSGRLGFKKKGRRGRRSGFNAEGPMADQIVAAIPFWERIPKSSNKCLRYGSPGPNILVPLWFSPVST